MKRITTFSSTAIDFQKSIYKLLKLEDFLESSLHSLVHFDIDTSIPSPSRLQPDLQVLYTLKQVYKKVLSQSKSKDDKSHLEISSEAEAYFKLTKLTVIEIMNLGFQHSTKNLWCVY